MMKLRFFYVALSAATVLILAGCDNPPQGWYKTTGGYINLNRVSRIESYGKVENNGVMIFNGALSKENLTQVYENVQKADANAKFNMAANISFDNNYVIEMPAGNNVSREEALAIIDDWSAAMTRLARQLPEN